MNMATTDLSKIITPDLLSRVFKLRIPYTLDKSIDFNDVALQFIDGEHQFKEWQNLCSHPLKVLSTLGILDIPDLMQLLPPPESKSFPQQALGLQVLLDQAPRLLCQGIDSRWVGGYSDIISLGLLNKFNSLPRETRPYAKNRWTNELGATFGLWAIVRFWFIAPAVHSESSPAHAYARESIEEMRSEMESFTGKTDPYRDSMEEYLKDVYVFPKLINAGPPKGPNLKIEELFFWLAILMATHLIILDVYGRYPYRNGALGRDSTEEEKEWLTATDYFGSIPEDIAKKIEEDVKADRWTALFSSSL